MSNGAKPIPVRHGHTVAHFYSVEDAARFACIVNAAMVLDKSDEQVNNKHSRLYANISEFIFDVKGKLAASVDLHDNSLRELLEVACDKKIIGEELANEIHKIDNMYRDLQDFTTQKLRGLKSELDKCGRAKSMMLDTTHIVPAPDVIHSGNDMVKNVGTKKKLFLNELVVDNGVSAERNAQGIEFDQNSSQGRLDANEFRMKLHEHDGSNDDDSTWSSLRLEEEQHCMAQEDAISHEIAEIAAKLTSKLDVPGRNQDIYDHELSKFVCSHIERDAKDLNQLPSRDKKRISLVRDVIGPCKSFDVAGKCVRIWDRCHSSGDPSFENDLHLIAYLRAAEKLLVAYCFQQSIPLGSIVKERRRILDARRKLTL